MLVLNAVSFIEAARSGSGYHRELIWNAFWVCKNLEQHLKTFPFFSWYISGLLLFDKVLLARKVSFVQVERLHQFPRRTEWRHHLGKTSLWSSGKVMCGEVILAELISCEWISLIRFSSGRVPTVCQYCCSYVSTHIHRDAHTHRQTRIQTHDVV